MKNSLLIKSVLFLFCAITGFHAICNQSAAQKEQVADCLPPTSYTYLDIGNVRARIIAGGDMWWDLAGDAYYEVPKGSQKHSMFSAALWIGGVDDYGQLRIAGEMYRQLGTDYYPGPLTIDGNASTNQTECNSWDRLFVLYKQQVAEFVSWFENPSQYPSYVIPDFIKTYPAHGDVTKGQARYLAPFYDRDGNGVYNYTKGDYPLYDFSNELCPLFYGWGSMIRPTMGSDFTYGEPSETGGVMYDQALKGDQTLWWVFNDKGNAHTQTGGQPIGVEVRAQAFAFKQPYDVSFATFYSYEIINRSTRQLNETYVGLYLDFDIGYAFDDYLGCDVGRGLGYAYNGNSIDGLGQSGHYGSNPPAVGVKILSGPYMDPDGADNPKYEEVFDTITNEFIQTQICDVSINGSNFGNGIYDDERLGMTGFMYYNHSYMFYPPPFLPEHYYRWMRNLHFDETPVLYGSTGSYFSTGYGPECRFIFPGESDPCHWGTGGIEPYGPVNWTEESVGNTPYDRRAVMSSGPFTMMPGSVHYLTFAVPWGRAYDGNPLSSVEKMINVSDKIQRLFDNCFRTVDGPDAPDLFVRELDRELIIYLANKPNSNNYNESFVECDVSIVSPPGKSYDSLYRFEGYLIYQLKDQDVKANDFENPDLARLVAQCDVKNGISSLVNYEYNSEHDVFFAQEMVSGEDKGIIHSFRILEDMFATGNDKRIVNNKKYYYSVIAYGFNEYEKFSSSPDNQFPGIISINGQQKPFLAGRKNIKAYTAIPTNPSATSGGTILNSVYGQQPAITRIEGHGNGGMIVMLESDMHNRILNENKCELLEYEPGFGPVQVKVIDPLGIKPANYTLRFLPDTSEILNSHWVLTARFRDETSATYNSDHPVSIFNEQIFPELGISLTIAQSSYPGDRNHETYGFLGAEIIYENPSNQWFGGIADVDGTSPYNWIRSGKAVDVNNYLNSDYSEGAGNFIDPDEHYENLLGGTWAPYRLVSRVLDFGPAWINQTSQNQSKMEFLHSVDVVITPDKSKWSRCPVIETGHDKTISVDNVEKHHIRKAPSVDKNGNPDGTGTGMGWFPGYAINVETGERLNVMFGENSWLAGDNGNDMLFNPTSTAETNLGEVIFGGTHFLYIFGTFPDSLDKSPAYDGGSWAKNQLDIANTTSLRKLYSSVMWVSIPMAIANTNWLADEVTIRIRVTRPYKRWFSSSGWGAAYVQNGDYPMYKFSTFGMEASIGQHLIAQSALDMINIVPNPYYAYSDYEGSQTEMLVKITNLPYVCTVSIFNASGSLVRQFQKNDNFPTIEWDLKNQAGDVIAGGIYLIHVHVPGVGERTLKWFGSMRNSTQSF